MSNPQKKDEREPHVDTFIYEGFQENQYARWVLMHMRLPAALQIDFAPFMEHALLFCTYQGKRYRVTGASRIGDVWLHSNPEVNIGYEHRVSARECSDWTVPAEGLEEVRRARLETLFRTLPRGEKAKFFESLRQSYCIGCWSEDPGCFCERDE